MAEPTFTFSSEVRPICEIGISPKRQAEPNSWLDVSCYVHEAELFCGRERFNERFEPGTASATFSNDDGWADLGGTYTEVAAAYLRPGRQIRFGVHGPWTAGLASFTRWLYRGFIDQATPAYDPELHDVVTVQCIDALGESGQTTAPAGNLQGVNETAAQRINRVLDAVGWFGSKRKIDATTTTVQGTQLGSPAVDLMGQAADSAGGVVFGDLDGDVVFRDIDWMLYDPDTPPDGTIGPGEPGAPPTGDPPYIDPTPGPVYDPDDPPAVHPPKVCVCADGTEGTLIEKGDNYRLYVRDGHLFYESGGTTWDLGPYSGGCTCVEPPDGGPPERSDDPDEDGDYDINPFPPVELPPQFGVELLAWADGGLSDPPAAAVTVAGIAPGHDCLLAVFVNALGTDTNATGLAPTFAGGGLDWGHRRDADQTSDGASSFIALAAVGRDDPGSFAVVVTWAAGMTSRSHIVTVWKITAAANNYLARFDAGAVLYATTDSSLDEGEPGNGPNTVELAADQQPHDVPGYTRPVDITIAQSLAEEGTPPFGAILAGDWTIPPNEPPMPEPALLDAPPWEDDFERADGPLGANWVLGPGAGFEDGEIFEFSIDSGAAIATAVSTGSGPQIGTMMYWAEGQGASQIIEVELEDVYFPAVASGYFQLYTHIHGTDKASQFADFFFNASTGTIDIQLSHFTSDGTQVSGAGGTGSFTRDPTEPVRVRLESDADGTQRAYVDDTLALTWVDPAPATGTFVGMGTELYDDSPASPRVLRAAGSSLGRVRKTSWVAGWRVGDVYHNVTLEDVNIGPSDIQSAQACLVVESAESVSGWRILGYDLTAATTGVTSAGTLSFANPPRPGALVVVMVGVTASSDVIDAVTVTGADFTRTVVQHKTGSSRGQGAIFTATAPLDLLVDSWAVHVAHPEVESVSAVVYEVTAQDDVGPVGAVASGVLGDNTAGSVDGASTITLSAAGDAAAVVLAYLHAAADASSGSGAATEDGSEWHEELNYSPASQRGYLHTMSRAPGQPESTSTSVHWDDVQIGTTDTYSAVQLAIEIHPFDGLSTTGSADPVALGGVTDPWNGTIRTAGGYNPDGSPIWTFP